MPLYDFQCQETGAAFEDIVPSDQVTTRCTICLKCKPERLIAATHAFNVIQATTKTSGAHKAGSVHRFKRGKTPGKIQSGWTPATK